MATRPAHIAGTISHAGNPSTTSDLSSSSQEDKPEETSKQALEALIEEILIFEDNGPMPVTGSMRYLLQLVVNSQIMQVRLGTRQAISVKNDGGVCVTRQGSFTGSDRYDIVPVLSLEAKRRSAGEIHRPSGETEEWTTRPLGQEVAELLGQATAQSLELDGWKDQHALVASTHGTVVRLTAADIKESYLSHLNSPTMPISECLFVVRSQGYDLRTREERDGALLLFIGVIEYLKSERAIIGQLQAIRGERNSRQGVKLIVSTKWGVDKNVNLW
ncbi:hypothetical protein ABEF93_000177 [Exophiala dermatitidis]